MKWIGQHIWDFISRFRSDVYLESIADASEDTDKFLVAKSDGKVAYRTGAEVLSDIGASSESTDLEFSGSTANGLLTYGGAAQIDVESLATFNPTFSRLQITSSAVVQPSIYIENTGDNVSANYMYFVKTRTGVNGDYMSDMRFKGKDGSGNPLQDFASFSTQMENVTHNEEAGKASINVVASNGSTPLLRNGLEAVGHGTNNTVDVDLGYGAASTTTIAGTLTMGSTAFVNNSGVVQVATQGTIDHDSLANFVTAEHVDWAGASAGTIHSSNIPTLNQNTTGTAATVTGAAQTNITSVGTLTNLDVDNININGDTITASADLSIVATGDDIAVDTDNFVIESATNGRPNLDIKTTYAGNKPANIYFKKDKGADGADDDFIGRIYFVSDNDAQEQITFANISGEVRLAADGAEEGRFSINIKNTNHASSPEESFLLTANGAATDVKLGFGATSVTTMAGETVLTKTTTLLNNQPLSFSDLDNSQVVYLRGPVTQAANRTIALPDANGTIALVDSTARQVVSLRTDDAYVMYLGNVNRWYQANRVFSSIGTQSTLDGESVTDSVAITAASYIAIRACTVHSVVIAWYPTQTSDIEFEILKVPLVDDSTSNVTFAKMTHTDHNASYTANKNYVRTFAITGGNTLTAGQGLALVARRTSGSATYMNGGQIYAEIEITG